MLYYKHNQPLKTEVNMFEHPYHYTHHSYCSSDSNAVAVAEPSYSAPMLVPNPSNPGELIVKSRIH